MRKALQPTFPQVAQIQLSDYKVRILNGNSGTGAITRVLIDWHDGNERRWSTVGAGTNILDATWLALADGYEFALSTAAQPAVKSNFSMNAKIVLLPGDGIGPEVVNEARASSSMRSPNFSATNLNIPSSCSVAAPSMPPAPRCPRPR